MFDHVSFFLTIDPAARPIKSVLPVIGDQPESKLPDEPCPFSKDVTPISNGQENSEIEPDTIQNGNEPDTKEPGNEPDTKEPGNEPDTKEHGNEPDTIEHGNEPDNTPLTINTEDSSTVDNSTIEHETITIDTSNQDNMTHDEIEKETTTVLKPDNEKQTVEVLPNDSSNNAAGEIEPVEKKINLEELSDDLVDGLTQDPTPGKGPGTNGGNTPQPAVTHIKANIHITTASHLVIKSSDEGDPDADPPISSGTDTPTDFEGSGGVMSKSEDEPGNMTGKGSGSDQTNVGKSSFFVDSGHSTDSPIRKESPKDARRGKSHSVFYSRKSESPPPDKTDKTKLSKLKRSFKRTNKIKREVSTDAGSVSLMAPQLATNWDPTCILEELYSDCRPVVPQSSTGESSRFAGYLDKLPVNQSKPAVMKGWKHRYFRVTRGSLFYYDDDKSQKAISFVRLTDARIVLHLESLKVEINEKNGNFIFLRAENRDEAQALQRALQLESVHPTLTHRLSLSPGRATPTIILDLGSCSVRAGLVSDDSYPQLFFPNVCAFSNHTLLACGSDSLLPSTRGVAKLVYPRRHRARMDSSISIRECFTAIVEDICKRLDVKPENCNMLASISPIMPEMEQQILAEVVLETLGFQGLLVQEQTTLALYSYNCTTGISVNVGDSVSVVPIVDGYKVEGADQHLPLGGGNISEHLSKLASARDIRYFSDTEMYIIRHVKETLCFVSQDYFKDVSNCDETPYQYTRAVDLDKFQLPDHKKVIALDIALFKAPEGLFQPIVWGKDVPSIQEMVHRSIEQCPIDFKREMCRHIYLSGGTTLMTGFPERLKAELSKLMPRVEIVIHADENRHHSAYLGASILASLNSYQKSLVTPDDWITDGFDAFRKTN